MKYQININQQVLADTALDLVDAAILDYIIFYCGSTSPKITSKRIIKDEKIWTWINYDAIIEDLPMLRIKTKNSITPRIHNIENEGFIETTIGQHSRMYICLTPKADSTIVKMNLDKEFEANSSIVETNLDPKNRQNNSQVSSLRVLKTGTDTHNSKYRQNEHDKDTSNTDTKDKAPEKISFVKGFIQRFNELFESKYAPTNGRAEKLHTRLETFTTGQIMTALENLAKSEFHRGVNDRGWVADPDFLIRTDEQIDKWLNKSAPREAEPVVVDAPDEHWERVKRLEFIRKQKEAKEHGHQS